VVLLGTQSVGKTSFIHRYTKKEFSSSQSTVSANISTRKNYVNGVKVKLQVSLIPCLKEMGGQRPG
jgi:GTPase SAR1 family protein